MSHLPWLNSHELYFPDTNTALTDPNGLLAVGGDLSSERLIHAYQRGIFPWYEEGEPILWWSPDPRAVLFPNQIHISKSLAKCIRKKKFTATCDKQFQQVIEHCANTDRKNQHGTWITEDVIQAYCTLHAMGIAHSVEVWQDQRLVGGLYGINLGKLFFGESMFSLVSNASKIAFVALAQNTSRWGFPLIDCQVSNPHLTTLGAQLIERSIFNEYLISHAQQPTTVDWANSWQDIANE